MRTAKVCDISDASAGLIMALSTVYRAWAVWYHNLQAPVVIFQAPFPWEVVNYLVHTPRKENINNIKSK